MMTSLLFKGMERRHMRGLTYSRRRYFVDDPDYPDLPAYTGNSRHAAVNWMLRLLRLLHG